MTISRIAVRSFVLAALAGGLSGCLAATAAGAAAGIAGAAVGVTAKAAGETVHVGHVAVDAVTGSGGDQPDGRAN